MPVDNFIVEKTANELIKHSEIAFNGLNLWDSFSTITILFSGGVDSLMVAIITGRTAPKNAKIVLVNVAFGETEKVSFSVFKQ